MAVDNKRIGTDVRILFSTSWVFQWIGVVANGDLEVLQSVDIDSGDDFQVGESLLSAEICLPPRVLLVESCIVVGACDWVVCIFPLASIACVSIDTV